MLNLPISQIKKNLWLQIIFNALLHLLAQISYKFFKYNLCASGYNLLNQFNDLVAPYQELNSEFGYILFVSYNTVSNICLLREGIVDLHDSPVQKSWCKVSRGNTQQQIRIMTVQLLLTLQRNKKCSLPRNYDKELYKTRYIIENFFLKIKKFRSIATRYTKKYLILPSLPRNRLHHVLLPFPLTPTLNYSSEKKQQMKHGADWETRTLDLLITNQLLYQLS